MPKRKKAKLTLAQARDIVKEAIIEKGVKVSSFSSQEITNCAKELIKHES